MYAIRSRSGRYCYSRMGDSFPLEKRTFARPDVAKAIGDDSLMTSGFDFVIPSEELGRTK